MKLTNLPNLRTEDFPSQQSWISKLFIQLNPLFQSINQVLDRNVDYLTNIKAVTKDYDITTFQAFSFTWPFTDSTPADLRVTKALKGSLLTPAILLVAWDYDSTTALITISRMVEITNSAVAALSGRYKFTIRVTV